MRIVHPSSTLLVLALALSAAAPAAPSAEPSDETDHGPFAGLELRPLGPALMSGRIADIAIHPEDPATWYVAVGSGGVWKTTNAGTTWTPLFDDQASYSIGCVALDPTNPEVVWVGTGENVGGRHVGFGDGVYRSDDGGSSWRRMGLERSEHISKILVDPRNPDVVWVASQGPLWSPGGERGLYRSDDGGATWNQVLGDDEWTGVTDVVMDPRDPDSLVAATWQRHRTVAAYIGGGPRSGLHRTTDGGATWTKLSEGLPKGNLGKIGLAISPQQPDVLYAAIELDRRTGGVWRSANRGASWEKRSDMVSGGTGPHYYQELVASPHAFDRIYLMDVRVRVSDDGGRTFRRLGNEHKHSDDHALAFHPTDADWLLAGTDGGLYESFDHGATWRFVPNLPVTQFYKVAIDDRVPFYSVYGGTQDNSTQGGPARTDTVHGIRSSDWFLTLFADGHQPAVEPGNPDIVYSEWQEGNLARHDRRTGEIVYIQPQPEPDAPPERFNWDSPILISPHDPKRLYVASQRVWRSDDRGDSWRPVSPDLTRDQDRMLLPLMGRQWSWDAPWDLVAMSAYNTVTSLAESPLVEGLLYAGTDDGLIQVSEDGGGSWRRIEVGRLPGVPATAFVNHLLADLFDPDTVYVALDHHKTGDFAPYVLRSTDRGRSWSPIAGDLPDRHLVWRLAQDHRRQTLLFAGTELGLFVTLDGGSSWHELDGGVPTIPFRDLAIHREMDDLVGATFGRGFYVLDDYSCLREVEMVDLEAAALLCPIRDAWWYVPRRPLGGSEKADQGASFFTAPNPPFGAVVTYHLGEPLERRAERRARDEEGRREAGEETPFPGWDEITEELRETEPTVVVTIRAEDGSVVRRLTGPSGAGFHRVAWDLRYADPSPVLDAEQATEDRDEGPITGGPLAPPGRYTASIAARVDGTVTPLAGPVAFEVARLREGTLEGAPPAETSAFARRVAEAQRRYEAAGAAVGPLLDRIERLQVALDRSQNDPGSVGADLERLRATVLDLEEGLVGPKARRAVGEVYPHSVRSRIDAASTGIRYSTYGPTPNLERTLAIAEEQLGRVAVALDAIRSQSLPEIEARAEAAGAPWTPERPLPGGVPAKNP